MKTARGISILVPFRSDSARRSATWHWLLRYWTIRLPDAEFIEGHNAAVPFSKTSAVNDAFRRSTGDIIIIMDADCYLQASVILECARSIRRDRRRGHKTWFIPYRHFYRLTEAASDGVLASNPSDPLRFSSPPPAEDTELATGQSVGHWFGALIQIMPREAFIAAGGMDERFSGWGGEDVSFMAAVDTLYAPHWTTRNQVLHLWHPHAGVEHWERTWEGQPEPSSNNPLANLYTGAFGRPDRMRALTREPGAGTL